MEIRFSEKYQLLFSLLDSQTDELKAVDTVLMYGGRDSGKSFAESVFIPIACSDYNHRVLYTRYTMNSTDQSISEALTERMNLLNIADRFEYANNLYTCKHNQGKIFITGQKTSSLNQTAKLKSLENFSIFVTDEAEEIKTFDEWDKIRKSIRAKDVQCLNILVFNPPTKEHWLYKEFFEDLNVQPGFTGIKDNVMYIHTTYKDNIDHVAPHNLREYLKLETDYNEFELIPKDQRDSAPIKLKKNWKKYKHVVLGGFLDIADGVIYEDFEIGEFNESLPYCYGLDFGFSDEDCCVKVAVDHGRMLIHVKEILYKNSLGTDQLGEMLINLVGGSDLIIADAAQKRTINDLYYKGLNIKRCRKGAGSVQFGIKKIQGYTIVVTPESANVIKSLNNYVWHDSRAEVPRHEWSHAMDALRYAAMELIEY